MQGFATVVAGGHEIGVALAEVAESVQKSVVVIRTGRGAGSGVIWLHEGLIVTNRHVVDGAAMVEVMLADGRRLQGRVVALDVGADLAAVVVQEKNLPAVKVRMSETLRAGELVLAVGNPLGLRNAVTAGIVSGVGYGRASERRPGVVYANVQLWPGNSGGPLVDVYGVVIGINSMVTGPGCALAVPCESIVNFLGKTVER